MGQSKCPDFGVLPFLDVCILDIDYTHSWKIIWDKIMNFNIENFKILLSILELIKKITLHRRGAQINSKLAMTHKFVSAKVIIFL